ncbi:hypothetical protein E1264_20255 [Actinomadura sp. KC216]|nr:hypothetical protein E1264_20255 [Actinomadura sp. KC216]
MAGERRRAAPPGPGHRSGRPPRGGQADGGRGGPADPRPRRRLPGPGRYPEARTRAVKRAC